MANSETSYRVFGVARDQMRKRPLQGLVVKAFDVDFLGADDFLGEATTKADGSFVIRYRDEGFVRNILEAFLEGGPDLLLKVYDPAGKLLYTTATRRGASRFEAYEMELEGMDVAVPPPIRRLDGRAAIGDLVHDGTAVEAMKRSGVWSVNDLRSMDIGAVLEMPSVREAGLTRERLDHLQRVAFLSAVTTKPEVAEVLVTAGVGSVTELAQLRLDEVTQEVESAVADGRVSNKLRPSVEELWESIAEAAELTGWFARERVYDLVRRGDTGCSNCDDDCCGPNPSVLSKAAYLAYLVRKSRQVPDALRDTLHQDFLAPDCAPVSMVRLGIEVLYRAAQHGDFGTETGPSAAQLMLVYQAVVRAELLRHRGKLARGDVELFERENLDRPPWDEADLRDFKHVPETAERIHQINRQLADFFHEHTRLSKEAIDAAWLRASREMILSTADMLGALYAEQASILADGRAGSSDGRPGRATVEIAKQLRSALIALSKNDESSLRQRYHLNFLADDEPVSPCDQAIVTLQESMRCDRAWYIACCDAQGGADLQSHDRLVTRFKDYAQYRLWVEQQLYPENFYDQHVQTPLVHGDVGALRERLSVAREILLDVTKRVPSTSKREELASVMGVFDEGLQVIGNLLDVDRLMAEGHQAARDEEYGVALAHYGEAQARLRRHAGQYHSANLATYEQIFLGTPTECAGVGELLTNAAAVMTKLERGQLSANLTRSLIPGMAPDRMNVDGWFPRMDEFPKAELDGTWDALVNLVWDPFDEVARLAEGQRLTLLNLLILPDGKRHEEVRAGAEDAGWRIHDFGAQGARRSLPLIVRQTPDFQKAVDQLEAATKKLLFELFNSAFLESLNEFRETAYRAELTLARNLNDAKEDWDAASRRLDTEEALDAIATMINAIEGYLNRVVDGLASMLMDVITKAGDFASNVFANLDISLPALPDSFEKLAKLPAKMQAEAERLFLTLAADVIGLQDAIENSKHSAENFCDAVVSALTNTILVDDESVWGSRSGGTIEELSNLHNVDDVRASKDGQLLRRGTLLLDKKSLQEAAASYEAVFTLQTSDNDDIGIAFHVSGIDGQPSYYLLSLRSHEGEDDWRTWAHAGFLVGYPLAVLGLAACTQVGAPALGGLFGGGFGLDLGLAAAPIAASQIIVAGALAFPIALQTASLLEDSLFPNDTSGAFVRLLKVRGGSAFEPAWKVTPTTYKPKPNQPYTIKLTVEPRELESGIRAPNVSVQVFEGEYNGEEAVQPVVEFEGLDADEPLGPGGVGLYAFANSPSKFLRADLTTQRTAGSGRGHCSLGELLFLPGLRDDGTRHGVAWSAYRERKRCDADRLKECLHVSADAFQPTWVHEPNGEVPPPAEYVDLSLFGVEEPEDSTLPYRAFDRRVDRHVLAELTNRLVELIPHQYYFLLPLSIADVLHAMGDYEGAKRHYDVCYDAFPNEVERRADGNAVHHADPPPGRRYSYLHADDPAQSRVGVEERLLRVRHAANELAMGQSALAAETPEGRQRAYEHMVRVLRVHGRTRCCNLWPGKVSCVPGAAPYLRMAEGIVFDAGLFSDGIPSGGQPPEDIPPAFLECAADYRRLQRLLKSLTDEQRRELSMSAAMAGLQRIEDAANCKRVRLLLVAVERLVREARSRILGAPAGRERLRLGERAKARTVTNYERAKRNGTDAVSWMLPAASRRRDADPAARTAGGEFPPTMFVTHSAPGALLPPVPSGTNGKPETPDPCGTKAELVLLGELLDRETFGGCAPGNPQVRAQLGLACLYLSRLDSGIGLLGLRPGGQAGYRYPYLLSLARHYTACAVTAEKDFIQFREKLSSARLSMMQWEHSVRTLGTQARMQQIALRQAEVERQAANYQVRMLDARDEQLGDQLGLKELEMRLVVVAATTATATEFVQGVVKTSASAAVAAASGGAALPAVAPGLTETAGSLVNGPLGAMQGAFGVYQQAELIRQQRELLTVFERPMAQLAETNALLGERAAALQLELGRSEMTYAESVCSYMATQFLGAEMYSFLARQMKRNYRHYLTLATQAARMAEDALELERGRDLNVIKAGYFDVSVQGLLGGEALASDLESLEFQRVARDEARQYPPARVLSLANAFPLQFQAFRSSGALAFRTEEIDFDREFAGHYYRQIRTVRVVIYALAGREGLKATLTHLGASEVVIHDGDDGYRSHVLPAAVERLALTGSPDGAGLIALNPVGDEHLNPFEGKGVVGNWLLELPKYANAIDYQSIADVLFIVDYSSFYDEGYRLEVEERMRARSWRGSRAVRVHQELPDGFYHLRHAGAAGPELTTSQALNRCTIEIPLPRSAYPPNEDQRKLDGIVLAFIEKSGESLDLKDAEIWVATRRHIESLWRTGCWLELEKPPTTQSDSTWIETEGELRVGTELQARAAGARCYNGKWHRVLRRDRLIWVPDNQWIPGRSEGELAKDLDFQNQTLPLEVPAELMRLAQIEMRRHLCARPEVKQYVALSEYFELRVRDDGSPPRPDLKRIRRGNEIEWVDFSVQDPEVEQGEWVREFNPGFKTDNNSRSPQFEWVFPGGSAPSSGNFVAEDTFFVTVRLPLQHRLSDEDDHLREEPVNLSRLSEVVGLFNYSYMLPG